MKNLIGYLFLLLLLTGCQEAANENKKLDVCPKNATLQYPLKTGQKNIFRFEDITTTPSTYYYDDGYEKRGYARAFKNLQDGTVHDEHFDLYWQDNEAVEDTNATDAENYCKNLTLAGYTDWRLPNLYELSTLMDLGTQNDLINPGFYTMPHGAYYSSNEATNRYQIFVADFESNNFEITKVDKVIDLNNSSPLYGVYVGSIQKPKYDSKGILLYILDELTYYDEKKNMLTSLTTYQRYDENGTLIATDGPFLTQETPLHPPEIEKVVKPYIKCVRGKEVKGFHFVRDNKRGIVKDTATNLMWQDTPDVVNARFQWGGAVKYCSELRLGGYRDWRLPTVTELLTLVDLNRSSVFAVDDTFLYRCACRFHSSSDLCGGELCEQKNLQLNTCGALDPLIMENDSVDTNPYDKNTSEPYFKVRCVRCGK
jgi:hypothetical protein